MITEEKPCTKCGEAKPLSEFHRNRSRPDGRATYCAACFAPLARTQNVRRRTSGKTLERSRAEAQTVEGNSRRLLSSAKHRAEKNNIPFNLTIDWISDRVRGGVCEATGIPFGSDYSEVRGRTHARAWGASLDRNDNDKGYTPDNVKVVCWAYNRAKGVDGEDVVLQMARALVARHGAGA